SMLKLEMIAIPGGTFMMGSPENEEGGIYFERPQHQVTIKPFSMGKYHITQAQWRAVAKLPQVNKELEPNPSCFKSDNRPVECVSWNDAQEFCARLSNHTKKPYRL
ncbi:MAG: formylglycine-generating enzyme family protein, partial [Dolichospermum sp.]